MEGRGQAERGQLCPSGLPVSQKGMRAHSRAAGVWSLLFQNEVRFCPGQGLLRQQLPIEICIFLGKRTVLEFR